MPTRSRTGEGSARRADPLDGLLAREVRLPASRVVPEDPGRDQARGGQGEAAEGPPDEVLGPDGAGESGPEGLVRSRGACGVEDGEVRVLLRRLDEARAKARLAEDRLEVLREQVARDVERAVAQALRDRGGRERSPELDPVDAGRLLRVAGVALENDAIRRVEGHLERPCAQSWRAPDAGAAMAVRGSVSSDGKIGSGSDSRMTTSLSAGRVDAVDLRRLARQVFRDAADRDERGGHLVARYFRFSGFVVEGGPLHTTTNIWVSDGQRQSEPPPTHHIEISGCEIRSGMGTGVLVSPNTDSVQLLGNSVHDNGDGSRQHQGLYFQGQNGLIANNLVYHQTNGFGIQVRGNYPDPDTEVEMPAHEVIVTNNTVVDNSLSGIVVENTASDVLVVNNISAFNGSHAVVGYDNESGAVLPGNRAHRNLAWDNSAGFGNTGRPVIDFSAGNIDGDPRFVGPQRRNYRLRAGSPAANHAIPAFAMPSDREGRRRSRPDLGAFER